MPPHECIQQENIGKFKEFIETTKGVRGTLTIIAVTILLQVGTFLYLWGGMVNTVSYQQKTLDKISEKIDSIKIIDHAYAEPIRR